MRYFIEVAYDGYQYSGFQIQNNAVTIQSKLTEVLTCILKTSVELTGSSRTDAKVNAYQNYFHFDYVHKIQPKIIYNLNAILPPDIAIKSIQQVIEDSHSRFSAISRTYEYVIISNKNPFLFNKAYYFPYKLDITKLNEAALIIKKNNYFKKFSKSNTQVNNFICSILESQWKIEQNKLVYTVQGNRFLRGMVKALVGTSLKYACSKMTKQQFYDLFVENNGNVKCDFSPPGYALFLTNVEYPKNIFL